MAARYRTVLSCGPGLRKTLLDSVEVKAHVGERIFPVISTIDEEPPFIAFRRTGCVEDGVKDGSGPRTAIFQMQIYAPTWEESVEIAEAVVEAAASPAPPVRICRMQDASETFAEENGCYVQILDFKVKF